MVLARARPSFLFPAFVHHSFLTAGVSFPSCRLPYLVVSPSLSLSIFIFLVRAFPSSQIVSILHITLSMICLNLYREIDGAAGGPRLVLHHPFWRTDCSTTYLRAS